MTAIKEKSKSQIRTELNNDIKAHLARGGKIQQVPYVKPIRKAKI